MSAPQSPTSTTSSARFRRETGFPEPFCGLRNTTLPHPDADTSPNATIGSEDVDPSRTTRRSFRARRSRYRHTLSYGKIDAASASAELLRAATSSSSGTGAGGDEELGPVSVVMLPDGRISKESSVEEARASFADERGEPVEVKRGLFKRILGRSEGSG